MIVVALVCNLPPVMGMLVLQHWCVFVYTLCIRYNCYVHNIIQTQRS